MVKKLKIEDCAGSLSTATMVPEDLIPCFMEFLQAVKEQCEIVNEVDALQEEIDALPIVQNEGNVWRPWSYADDEDTLSKVDWILGEDICNLLNEIAPDFFSFGSHPGDGADYGYWMYENIEESITEHLQYLTDCFNTAFGYLDLDYDDALEVIGAMKKIESIIRKQEEKNDNEAGTK